MGSIVGAIKGDPWSLDHGSLIADGEPFEGASILLCTIYGFGFWFRVLSSGFWGLRGEP